MLQVPGSTERVAVGSVKSNIGHLKAVAGCAGLLKVILALKHKTLPSTINVSIPPQLRDGTCLQDSALYINTRMRPWFPPAGITRRAGVSSFGFGGANYHCVVEEYERDHTRPYRTTRVAMPVVLSAEDVDSLRSLCVTEASNISHFDTFCSAFELSVARPKGPRVGFLATSIEQVVEQLQTIARLLGTDMDDAWERDGIVFRSHDAQGQLAMLFSGQGSQYPYMFDELAMNWPPFRASVMTMDSIGIPWNEGTAYSQFIYPRAPYKNEDTSLDVALNSTNVAQPTVTAMSAGCLRHFLRLWGLPAHGSRAQPWRDHGVVRGGACEP